MNVMWILTTALRTVTTLLVATSATVRMDTHWTLMNTLAMVNTSTVHCGTSTLLFLLLNTTIALIRQPYIEGVQSRQYNYTICALRV